MAHAHMPEELEQLNPIELQEFTERADEGAGRDAQPARLQARRRPRALRAEAVGPLLEKAGAGVMFAATAAAPLIGPSEWDVVAPVEYPTRRPHVSRAARRVGDGHEP